MTVPNTIYFFSRQILKKTFNRLNSILKHFGQNEKNCIQYVVDLTTFIKFSDASSYSSVRLCRMRLSQDFYFIFSLWHWKWRMAAVYSKQFSLCKTEPGWKREEKSRLGPHSAFKAIIQMYLMMCLLFVWGKSSHLTNL